MNKWIKYTLFILVVIYILSPVDLVPGPIDDLVLAIILLYQLFTGVSLSKSKKSSVFNLAEEMLDHQPTSQKQSTKKAQSGVKDGASDSSLPNIDYSEVVDGDIVEEINKTKKAS